jgi:FAD synthetase
LHLYAAALYRKFQEHTTIPSLYIPLPSSFPELESFICESIKTYDLNLFHCLPGKNKDGVQLSVETVMTPASGTPSQPKKGGGEGMKKALEMYKSEFPHVKGILIGTRRTDPYCGTVCVRSGLSMGPLTAH